MSVSVLNRQRRKARRGLLRGEPTTFILKAEPAPTGLSGTDMDVRYPQPMAGMTREVNREEWSRVIEELLLTEANGNRTHLAERIGVKYLTIKRWLDATNAVSEESVRQVARTFKIPVTQLLIRVGYYPEDELLRHAEGEPYPIFPGDDQIEATINGAPLTPSERRELREHVATRRAEAEAALKAEIERLIAAMRRPRRRTS